MSEALRALEPAPRYLLFSGLHGKAASGLGNLVGVFDRSDEAKAAFRALRLTTPSGDRWAELASLDRSGRLDLLCWFGRDRPVRSVPKPVLPREPPVEEAAGSRRRWRLLRSSV